MPAAKAEKLETTLIDVAQSAGQFSTFLRAVAAGDLLDTLRTRGPFTLFAPTDDAFDLFPASTLRKLMTPAHKPLLQKVLSYHFANGKVLAARFEGKRVRATTLEGGDLRISGVDGLTVNGASVSLPDILASNGVLHGIDRVLWPAARPIQISAFGNASV